MLLEKCHRWGEGIFFLPAPWPSVSCLLWVCCGTGGGLRGCTLQMVGCWLLNWLLMGVRYDVSLGCGLRCAGVTLDWGADMW